MVARTPTKVGGGGKGGIGKGCIPTHTMQMRSIETRK
jgi:hypothetical protein